MGRGLVAIASAFVVASCMLAACGNDYDESASTPAPAAGTLDGACYPNSTCNGDLKCVVVDGLAKCRPRGEPFDAGPKTSDATPQDAADAMTDAPTADVNTPNPPGDCNIESAGFKCKDDQKPIACFGDALSCRPETCEANERRWECIARSDCKNAACCLGSANLTSMQQGCDPPSTMTAGIATAKCRSTCEPGEVQLCQSSVDCPADFRCQPYQITSTTPAALFGATVGVCAKR